MKIDRPGHAQPRHDRPKGKAEQARLAAAFQALDADRDGTLSDQELLAKGAAKFASRDMNGDGKVTKRESKLSFKLLDADQDGQASPAQSDRLAGYDADGDGNISREEFENGQLADRREARKAIRDHAYEHLDQDGDGSLSREEASDLARYDADQDGIVTRAEFKDGMRADWRAQVDERVDARFSRADADGDGKLKGAEAGRFDRYDLNRDGRVSKLEFESGQESDRLARTERSILGEPVQADYGAGLEATFQRLDLDADGRLTGQEARGVRGYDANGDGAVSQEEFAGTPQAPGGADKPAAKGATSFVLSSFNVLSTGAGMGKGFAPGPERMKDVARILKANDVSVVGMQEMAHNQLLAFKKAAGDEYGTFAGASGKPGYHDTTLAWRKDTWKLVKGDHLTVPSYGGRSAKVPYVLLRNKQTGQEAYFLDVHNPANTKRYHHQEGFRDAAARKEAALAKQLLEKSGLPVFVVGDMNSVGEARHIFTGKAPLKAANPPGKSGIDWIFGSKDVKFSRFHRTRDGLIKKTTDHPVAFTHVKIDGK